MTTLALPPRSVKTIPHPASCDCPLCEDRAAAALAGSLGLADLPTPALMAHADGVIARVDAFLAMRAAAAWPEAEAEDLDGFTWELGPDPSDDQWHADQTPDSEGLTAGPRPFAPQTGGTAT